MHEIEYLRPATVREAVDALARGDARLLAGGTDLIAQLREGRRSVRRIVDLKHIPALTHLEQSSEGGWRIGAAASVGQLALHVDFAREHRALLDSARLIGSLQIQNRATLGGNLCNAAPSADAVPLLISHGARVEIAGASGTRTASLATIPAGPGRASLEPGEMVTAILLPAKTPRSAAKYLRFTPRREMDIAVAGSGVAIALDGHGAIASARITLASVAPVPLQATLAETLLVGERPSIALFEAAGRAAAREAKPISDTRGSADYRRELVAVLTRRALEASAAELGCKVT